MMTETTTTMIATDASADRYRSVRRLTERLCEPLKAEDYVIQSMPDVSPTKWHLAHTTWFFETFLLKPHVTNYQEFDPNFGFLFNSYYNTIGEFHPRQSRGMLSRPTVESLYAYRKYVDDCVSDLCASLDENQASILEIGLHHEQQHQELILTDIKHVLWANPVRPPYSVRRSAGATERPAELNWSRNEGGLREIGYAGPGFAFDNEGPRHKQFLQPFAIASRLVTNGEYLQFIQDGGYERPELWLSLGWATVQAEKWKSPLYWTERSNEWSQYTLGGMRAIEENGPVCHISFFEADAFARWSGARLPTEAEWEVAADSAELNGTFLESEVFHPMPAQAESGLEQFFGDVWQWTGSAYLGYPGYHAVKGALGEYNGKFMCNQFVLRGGSVATSRTHIRRTYRNFFPPAARWQFSGLRLARDL
jgi:ergothioneine biosynthesis protein EgtB